MVEELTEQTKTELDFTNSLFKLLSASRRRQLLACLHQHDEPLPLADVAEDVAVRERDCDIQSIPAEEVKRIYMSLYHKHIPLLEDEDVVKYYQDRDTVYLSDNADMLIPYIKVAENFK